MRTVWKKAIACVAACLLALLCHVASGQTPSQNYVRESILLDKFTSDPCTDYDFARNTVTYYDGLGRQVQTVKVGAGWNVFDIHTITEYDSYGKPCKAWLPVEMSKNSGEYLDPATVKSAAVEFYGDTYPYTETAYSKTPELWEESLRVPGAAWRARDKRTVMYKGLSSPSDPDYACLRFDVSPDGSLALNGTYAEGMLRYEESIDEDGIAVTRFFDRDSRMVLERRWGYGQSQRLDTYHVYNTVGQLSYVIPPKASAILAEDGDSECDTATVGKLCYRYAYDQYNRLIEKRLPGADAVYYVYDALDNILMTQDGNLRPSGKWRVVKLDSKYRKAVEGIASLAGETRSTLQEKWKDRLAIETPQPSYSNMADLFYTDTCGIAGFEPQVAYFYDNYDHWNNLSGAPLPSDSSYPSGMQNATGMLTGKAVWEDWYFVISAVTYDDKKRVVMECETDYDRFYLYTTFYKRSFVGDLTGKKTVYENNDISKTYKSEYSYTYDYWGSLLSVRHKVDDEPWTTLCGYTYDNVMRMSSKTVYPRNAASSSKRIAYSQNLRSWTTSVSSPLFSQRLHYNDSIPGCTPRWNGSPSAMTFTSVGGSGSLDTLTVAYGYDTFDRLVSVDSKSPADSGGLFSESFSYDENGNPEIITRGNASSPAQHISLSYDGNRIASLNESKAADGLYPGVPAIAKGDYESGWTYDANGNRTSDPSRGIASITYNTRNQPEKVTFNDGSALTHYYRSDGVLYRRNEREAVISTVSGAASATTTYKNSAWGMIGDFVLNSSSVPSRLYIEGGYIDLDYDSGATSYKYYVHDNQGSVRAVIDENGALRQAADYSAYGVPSTRYTSLSADNRLHLGLEWQPMKGVYGYYNNARFRDAVLAGSFYQQDPLAEKYYSFSPYHYSACNPIKLVDWSGMDIWEFNPGGYLAFHQKTDDNIDQLNMVDNLGKPIYKDGIPVTLSLEGSPIERHYVWKGENGAQYDFMRVRGDDNAKAIFEFLSEHITGSETMVEMGWAKTGIEGDKGLNFISTSHTPKEEGGIGQLYKGQLCNGYYIRELVHSHPMGDGTGSTDATFKGRIMGFQMDFNLPIPQFSIYYQPEKKYLKY